MLKSSLCDYSDAYVLVSGTKTVAGGGIEDAARAINRIQYLKVVHRLTTA